MSICSTLRLFAKRYHFATNPKLNLINLNFIVVYCSRFKQSQYADCCLLMNSDYLSIHSGCLDSILSNYCFENSS